MSTIDTRTQELLDDPNLDIERRLKLEYIVEQLSRPERADDTAFLQSVKRELVNRA